jgi:hypothetical protein
MHLASERLSRMESIERRASVRPSRMSADIFASFRVHCDGTLRSIGAADTLEQCVENAAMGLVHKDKLVVKQTDASGAVTLHVFVIRAGKPEWRSVNGIPTRWQRLYAEPVASFRP